MMKSLIKKGIVILLSGVLLFTTVWAEPNDDTIEHSDDAKAKKQTEADETPQVVQTGMTFGALDGGLAGKKDYINGQKSDYRKAMLKNEAIIKKYGLKTYSAKEIELFLSAYHVGFKKQYRQAMNEQLLEQHFSPATRGAQNGDSLGAAEGVASANVDLLNNAKSDWLLAYNNFIKAGDLATRYQLGLQEAGYAESFVISFKAGFKKAYREHYDTYVTAQAVNNTTYHLVQYAEDSVIYDKLTSQVDRGAEAGGSMSTASLLIERGTVYQDTYLSLQRTKNVTLVKNGNADAVSGIYQISIQKDRKGIKLYKPMKLKFIYNEDPNIGVYQWIYNHWQYVETTREADGVSIEIPAGVYRGGKYALFIDNDFIVPTDSVYSWAYEDIVLALKRKYIANSPNFRPDQSITRYEMADLIYQMMHYRLPLSAKQADMVDRNSITKSLMPVDFVINFGYMALDENQAFNPTQYVSYLEFADIMRRMTKKATFDYGSVASKMFYDRYAMSGYLNDKNGNPTRAEVIFTFNEYID